MTLPHSTPQTKKRRLRLTLTYTTVKHIELHGADLGQRKKGRLLRLAARYRLTQKRTRVVSLFCQHA